jgi:hypothetical protein
VRKESGNAKTAKLNPAGARRKFQPFRFPLPLPDKVAILGKGFGSGRNLRFFVPPDQRWIAWAPDALVLPLPLALLLADQKMRGLLELPALSVAIVVLTSITEGLMDQSQRDGLWRIFRVPVFEQLRAGDGSVIARECEVHLGLHVDPAFEVGQRATELLVGPQRTGVSVEIVHGCCECGAETPRLLKLARLLPALPGMAAAARAGH